MINNSAHKTMWETSEVVFGIPLLISIVFCFLLPLPIVNSIARWVFLPIGIILCLVGIEIIVLGRRELARYGQPTDPGKPTSQMVVSGVYSISRNPLYLGIVILFIGIALALNSWWFVLLLLPAFVTSHFILIYPEERYLIAKFGEQYLNYQRSVFRWLGRKSHPQQSQSVK